MRRCGLGGGCDIIVLLLLALCRATPPGGDVVVPPAAVVHVVIAGDATHSMGLLACARSVISSAREPWRLRLHLLTSRGFLPELKRAVRCALGRPRSNGGLHAYSIVGLAEDSKLAMRLNRLINVRHARKQYLASPLNYARFYLDKLLPGIQKVLWLDSDTVAQRDVAELYDISLVSSSTAAVAAVARDGKGVCGTFFNCSNPEALELLKERNLTLASLNAFNAGVLVIRLDRWRAQDVEWWLLANARTPVFALGTNPPLVLANSNFEHIQDPAWNCQVGSGHDCLAYDGPSVLHWSGDRKPWWPDSPASSSAVTNKTHRAVWLRAFDVRRTLRCLPRAHVPNSTFLVSSSSSSSSAATADSRAAALVGVVATLGRARGPGEPTLAVVLRGRIFLDRRDVREQMSPRRRSALLALHRATQLEHVTKEHNFADACVLEIADDLVTASSVFAPQHLAAVECDTTWAATRSQEALRLHFKRTGMALLTESDVLTSLAHSRVELAPLAFTDKDLYRRKRASRSKAVGKDGRKITGVAKVKNGFFSTRAPILITVDFI